MDSVVRNRGQATTGKLKTPKSGFLGRLLKPASLPGKLLVSHLSVASLGFMALLIAFMGTNTLRGTVVHLVTDASPKAVAAVTAMSGVQRSMAWLRLHSSQETYRAYRRKAWSDEIWPSISELVTLEVERDQPKIREIVAMLKELEGAQWWVEDAVESDGNVPSNTTLDVEILPLYNFMIPSIDSALADLGGRRSSTAALGAALAELKSDVQVSFFGMHDFVDSAEDWTERDILAALYKARSIMSSISAVDGKGELAETLEQIKAEFASYDHLMMRAFSERKADKWNIARWTMENEVIPIKERVTQALRLLAMKYSAEMEKEAEYATSLSRFVTVLISAMIVVMIALATVMSRRNAAKITQPVTALSSAAVEMAAGGITGDIPVIADDEIGRLTGAFNKMRASLEEKEAALKARADEMEKASKEMESFLYSVSHDLKVPMITIQGMSKLLERDLGANVSKDSQTYFNYIFGASATMSELLDDLLEISRVGRMDINPDVVDMNELAKKALAEAKALAKGRDITFIAQADMPPVFANRKRVYQLFSNLTANAVKFMPTGVAEPAVEIGCRPGPEGWWEFYVRDNGAGIDQKYQEKIFTLFTRLHGRDVEGTGMGLAFVRKILDNIGGTIRVESEPGKGAAFYFTLPQIPEGEKG
jgi:two-component system sensor kinase